MADVITDFLENVDVIDAYQNLPKLHSEVGKAHEKNEGKTKLS